MMARPLHRQENRTSPLPTDANTLNHTHEGQDDGTPNANRGIGRHKGNQESRNPHAQQRGDQGGLPANAIPIVAKYRGSNGAIGEADEIGAESRKGAS